MLALWSVGKVNLNIHNHWIYWFFSFFQILLCNTMACQILGYKRSELQSMTFENLVSNLDESLGASEEIDLLCDKKNDDIDTSEDLKVKGTVLVCGKVVSFFWCSESQFMLLSRKCLNNWQYIWDFLREMKYVNIWAVKKIFSWHLLNNFWRIISKRILLPSHSIAQKKTSPFFSWK